MRSEMSPDPRFPKQDGTFDQLIPGSVRDYRYYIIPTQQQSHQVTTLKGNATYIEKMKRNLGLKKMNYQSHININK